MQPGVLNNTTTGHIDVSSLKKETMDKLLSGHKFRRKYINITKSLLKEYV